MILLIAIVIYAVIAFGATITLARGWAFEPETNLKPGDAEYEYEWGLCIFLGTIGGLLWPLAILACLPWHRWPFKMQHEREGLARIQELAHQRRLKETGMDP